MMSSMMKMNSDVLSTDVQGTEDMTECSNAGGDVHTPARNELGAAKLVVGCYCLFVFHLV